MVKEAETLAQLGYDVKVICCFYQNWAQKFDGEITSRHPEMYLYCGGDPKNNRLAYLMTRIRHKMAFKLFRFTHKFSVAENAISRTHSEALKLAKKLKSDLYIAHNLGALPAAVMAAKYHCAKVGYDAEDMHSGQFTSEKDAYYQLNKYIEQKYFRSTDYFTAASELIGDGYKRMYPYLQPVIIDNVFPKTSLQAKPGKNDILKLFWFSQTVGAERGIEETILAMAMQTAAVELHLLGSCSADYKHILYSLAADKGLKQDQLHFHDPVSPDEVFAFAAQFDIGIAAETGTTLNRDICLTNKIFVYVQCGLVVIASDTSAQSLFLNDHPDTGKLFKKNDPQSMARAINYYTENRDKLDSTKEGNYRLGQTKLNWEKQSSKFLAVINDTLSN